MVPNENHTYPWDSQNQSNGTPAEPPLPPVPEESNLETLKTKQKTTRKKITVTRTKIKDMVLRRNSPRRIKTLLERVNASIKEAEEESDRLVPRVEALFAHHNINHKYTITHLINLPIPSERY